MLAETEVQDLKPIAALPRLVKLDIRNTLVTDLRPIQPMIQRGIKVLLGDEYGEGIFIAGCNILHPPRKTIQRGHDAVLQYFQTNSQ